MNLHLLCKFIITGNKVGFLLLLFSFFKEVLWLQMHNSESKALAYPKNPLFVYRFSSEIPPY